MPHKGTTIVVVSIDTEEDNWVPTRELVTVENLREMPRLHRFLSSYGARPTYFTAHSVVASPWGGDVMRGIAETGQAEVGGHLHPWNTPPLEEPFLPRNTMMKNLPADLQLKKLRALTNELTHAIGHPPEAFRAGRWGLGVDSVPQLLACGYRVDSSVMPFVDWSAVDEGANYDRAPTGVYRLGTMDLREPDPLGVMVELPVSSGYSRNPFADWHRFYERVTRPGLRVFRLGGLVNRIRLVRKIQLSPETDSLSDLLTLARRVVEANIGFLHVFFHSPSFTAGLNPYGATPRMVEGLYRTLGDFFDGLARITEVEFATATEAADAFEPPRVASASVGP